MHSPTDFKIHRSQSPAIDLRRPATRQTMPLSVKKQIKPVMLILMICIVNSFLLSHHLGTVIELKNEQIHNMIIERSHANDENISLRAQRAKLLSHPEIKKRAAQELGLTVKIQQRTRRKTAR